MPLSDVLANVPGYAGYNAARLRNRGEEMQNLQQVATLQQIVSQQQQMQQRQQLQGVTPEQMKDPEFWSRLALSTGKPEYQTHAERLKKDQADAAEFEQQRGKPTPTLLAGPAGAAPETPTYEGGIFDSLAASENPQIAAQAKQLKTSMERSGYNNPRYWQTQQAQLAARETALLNRPDRAAEPLHSIVGPDGKPVLVSRSDAVGKTPYSPSTAGATEPTFGKLAIESGAERYLMDGTMPPNLGRGAQGSGNIKAIQDRAAELAAERGLTADQVRQGQLGNKARQQALGQLEKSRNAIQSFEGMLSTNIDVLRDLSKDISRTDSPYANKPILWLKANAAGDPKVSEYLFQVNAVATEIARILNNPNMTGQLTDSARHELQGVLSGNMNAAQLNAVIDRAQKDAHNRSASLDNQATKLNREMRYWEKPKEATNYVETRVTADGRKLGKKADGTIEEIK